MHKNKTLAAFRCTRISRTGSYFKPVLVQVANALIKSQKHPEFTARYKRIKARRALQFKFFFISFRLLARIFLRPNSIFARAAGMADRQLEEPYRLSAAREAGGVDGNSCKGAERSKTGWNDCGIGKIGKRFKKLYALQVLLWK